MPSSRFLLPRDSLSKIVTGQMNWNTMEQHSRRQLLRYSTVQYSTVQHSQPVQPYNLKNTSYGQSHDETVRQ